jgi:hypothetical protein
MPLIKKRKAKEAIPSKGIKTVKTEVNSKYFSRFFQLTLILAGFGSKRCGFIIDGHAEMGTMQCLF